MKVGTREVAKFTRDVGGSIQCVAHGEVTVIGI